MYFNTDTVSLYYEKYGQGDDVILILPGWGDTRKTFDNIISYFSKNYTVYIFDYPGFGNSLIPSRDLTIYDYTNIFRDFITEKNIKNPTIIAHSFGGRIATLLTGYYKEKIDKMIFIDIASIKPKKNFWKFMKNILYKLLKMFCKLLPKEKQKKVIKTLVNLFGSKDYRMLPDKMRQTFKNIVNEDLKCYLKYIDSEVLLIWGELDDATPLRDGRIINSLIKNSALIIYPKAAHFSYLEYPFLTNSIIEKFIEKKES